MSEKYKHRPTDGVEADNYDATRDPNRLSPAEHRFIKWYLGKNDAGTEICVLNNDELHAKIKRLQAEIERLQQSLDASQALKNGDVVLVYSADIDYPYAWKACLFDQNNMSMFDTKIVRMDCDLQEAWRRLNSVREKYQQERANIIERENAEIIALGESVQVKPK